MKHLTSLHPNAIITAYRFRELTSREELLEYFQLRYEVYSNSVLSPFLSANSSGMDYDTHDLQATHFGLFAREAGAWKLVGGVRNIDTYRHPDKLESIGYLFGNEAIIPSKPLPALTYGFPGINTKTYEGGISTEGSRICVKRKYQGRSVGRFLLLNAMTILINRSGSLINFAAVRAGSHSKLYQLYGYRKLNAEPHLINGTWADVLCISCRDVVESYLKDIKHYAHQRQTQGYTEMGLPRPKRSFRQAQ